MGRVIDGYNIPVETPGVDESTVGYAGELISAILQTAGLYAQSDVLKLLEPYLTSLAVFVFIIAGLGGLISVALFGNYKSGAYLLFSPVFFFLVVSATTTARGTVHHYGEWEQEIHDPKALLNAVNWFGSDEDTPREAPQVSELYVWYDNLVSSVVQSLVAVLIETKNREHLVYVARERILSQIVYAEGAERGYVELVSAGLVGHCGRIAYLEHQLARVPRTQDQQALQNVYADEREQMIDRQIVLSEGIYSFVNRVIAYHYAKYSLVPAEQHTYLVDAGKYLIDEAPLRKEVSCDDIWRYTTLASWMLAEDVMLGSYDDAAYPDVPWEEARKHALLALQFDEGQAEERGEQSDKVITSKVAEVIGAYILKNTIGRSVYTRITDGVQSRAGWDPQIFRAIYGSVAEGEREGKRGRLEHFAGAVPYIQGALLFLLSFMFPMFAVFQLIPGRMKSFILWFTLWLWVKSWDVGFAMVHFVRDFFWQFMQGDIREGIVAANINWESPETIYYLMMSSDPTANLNTYYTFISLLTLSVPLLTAHLCFGASELVGALRGSIDTHSISFGDRKARAARRMEASMIERAHQQGEAYGVKSGVRAAKNDSGLKNILGESLSSKDGTTKAAHLDALKNWFSASYHFSDYANTQRNYLATMTGRGMSYQSGKGQLVAQAFTGLRNEEYEGRDIARGLKGIPQIPGIGFDPRSRERKHSVGWDSPTVSSSQAH